MVTRTRLNVTFIRTLPFLLNLPIKCMLQGASAILSQYIGLILPQMERSTTARTVKY